MERRRFLKLGTVAINALIGVALAIPVVRYLLHPLGLRAAGQSGEERGFIRVAPLSALKPNRPTRVVVSGRRRDSFTHYPPGPIGVVWLTRVDNGAGPEVSCLQATCPHLGCAVGYAADRGVFSCPCHASEFDPKGRRRFGPAPRDMDKLACRVTEPDESGRRWVEVRYQEFRTSVARSIPLG